MCKSSCKISVIVPVYNVEKYLCQCIDSILAQTFTDFELLLIDDGSTDRSGRICDEYVDRDARIRVFHTANRGVSAARNLGIGEARADWLCFIDSDDWVEKDYLSVFFYRPITEKESIVYQRIFFESKVCPRASKVYFNYENALLQFPGMSEGIIRFKVLNDGYVMAKLFNRRVILENGIRFYDELSLFEDIIFLSTYIRYVKEIRLYSSFSYHYVKRDIITLSMKSHTSEEYISVSDKLLKNLHILIKKFQIKDKTYLKEIYTLYGLNQLFSACFYADKSNYHEIFRYARTKKEYLKYYVPRTLKHKIFKFIFFKLKLFDVFFISFFLYNRRVYKT